MQKCVQWRERNQWFIKTCYAICPTLKFHPMQMVRKYRGTGLSVDVLQELIIQGLEDAWIKYTVNKMTTPFEDHVRGWVEGKILTYLRRGNSLLRHADLASLDQIVASDDDEGDGEILGNMIPARQSAEDNMHISNTVRKDGLDVLMDEAAFERIKSAFGSLDQNGLRMLIYDAFPNKDADDYRMLLKRNRKRDIMEAYYVDNLSTSAIAKKLGLKNRQAVAWHFKAAQKELFRYLRTDYGKRMLVTVLKERQVDGGQEVTDFDFDILL